MSSKNHPSNPFKAMVVNIIQKNRTIILGTLALSILGLVGFAIWTEVDKNTKYSYTVLLDQVQEDIAKWTTESASDKKSELEKKVNDQLNIMTAKYNDSYSKAMTNKTLGDWYFNQSSWSESAKYYTLAIQNIESSSFLLPIISLSLAAAHENGSNAASALEALDRVVTTSTDSIFVPQAIFLKGHILETLGQVDKAKEAYKTGNEKYPASSWSKLGKDRLIALN